MTQDLSPPLFSRSRAALQKGIQERVASAMVGGVWSAQDRNRFHIFSDGKTSWEADAKAVSNETVFDCASVSKGVATATTLARLVDRGWLDWETPVRAILPDYRFSNVLLSHLLSHSAGYVAWKPFWKELCLLPENERKKAIFQKLIDTELEVPPGTRRLYSDLSFLLLGYVIEAVTAQSLDHVVQKMVLDPIGMTSTCYRPIAKYPNPAPLIPVTSDAEGRGDMIAGQVHDENCWSIGGVSGHAGIFSTAGDLLKFAKALLSGFLSREQFVQVSRRFHLPADTDRTLGWDTPSPENASCGSLFSGHSFGHLGFTGTSLWMDVVNRRAVVLLTNRVHPTRENIAIRAFRPTFHDAILTDLLQN